MAIDPERLTVEPEARRFRVGGGEPVSLERRHAARRILWSLVQRAMSAAPAALATHELLALGWPGERVEAESGAHRVHVALATLRKLGLGGHIVRQELGYRLVGLIDVAAGDQPERRAISPGGGRPGRARQPTGAGRCPAGSR